MRFQSGWFTASDSPVEASTPMRNALEDEDSGSASVGVWFVGICIQFNVSEKFGWTLVRGDLPKVREEAAEPEARFPERFRRRTVSTKAKAVHERLSLSNVSRVPLRPRFCL